MQELLPLALGIPLAFAAMAIPNQQTRRTFIVIASIVLGITVSATVGELEASWAFAILDTAQVLFATVAVSWLWSVAKSSRARSS